MDFAGGNYLILKDPSLRRKAGITVLDSAVSEATRHSKRGSCCASCAKSGSKGCAGGAKAVAKDVAKDVAKGGAKVGGASVNAPHHIRRFGAPEAINAHTEQEGGGYFPYHYFTNNSKW